MERISVACRWFIDVGNNKLFNRPRHTDGDVGGVGACGDGDGRGGDRIVGADVAGLEDGGFATSVQSRTVRHLGRERPDDAAGSIAVGQGEDGVFKATGTSEKFGRRDLDAVQSEDHTLAFACKGSVRRIGRVGAEQSCGILSYEEHARRNTAKLCI